MNEPVSRLLLVVLLAGMALARVDGQSARSPTSEFGTGTVRANGLTFSYIEAGKGPLVLALHGFPDHPRTFRNQMRALAAAGYHVVAPFERGYAPTDVPPDGAYESSALVADAIALIDALGGGRPAIIIGHDWGAVAAYGAAAVAPEKVAKLVAIAVPGDGSLGRALLTNPAQQRRSWYMYFFGTPFAERAVQRDDFAFLDQLWSDWSPGWSHPAAEMDSVKAIMRRPGSLHAALNYYRENLGMSSAARAAALDSIRKWSGRSIAVPTLYLVGADDHCIGVEVSDSVQQRFSGPFEMHVIAGAGHFVQQEQPLEVNRLILGFLGQAR